MCIRDRKDVKPLEIILDDSELSDLTQCFDLLRFDSRFNLNWNITSDRPYSKRYIQSTAYRSKKRFTLFYAFILFLSTSSLMLLIPTNNKFDLSEPTKSSQTINE